MQGTPAIARNGFHPIKGTFKCLWQSRLQLGHIRRLFPSCGIRLSTNNFPIEKAKDGARHLSEFEKTPLGPIRTLATYFDFGIALGRISANTSSTCAPSRNQVPIRCFSSTEYASSIESMLQRVDMPVETRTLFTISSSVCERLHPSWIARRLTAEAPSIPCFASSAMQSFTLTISNSNDLSNKISNRRYGFQRTPAWQKFLSKAIRLYTALTKKHEELNYLTKKHH